MAYVKPPHHLQLSRDLIKIAIEKNEIENFRIYTILRQANIPFGKFKLSYLAELLYPNETPSNRKKHINILSSKLKKSIFFKYIQGDLFRIIAYGKILRKHKGNAKTWFYTLPRFTISTRRSFFDACIGLCLIGEMSNEKASQLFKCSKRRIQLATKRNNEANLFIKHIRRVIEPFPTFSEAKKMQAELKDIGIITSNPFDYKGGQAISVNRTNKYTSGVLRRYKGKIRKRTHATTKRAQWFKPSFRGKGSRDTRLYYEARYNSKFYEFNDKVYSLNDFVLAHASI